MSYQTTLERTLEMMALLSRSGGFRTKDLAEHFEVSVRSIQRTIFTIRMAGYVVEENAGRYKINHYETKKKNSFDVGDLLHFSKEESWMLQEAIDNLPGNNTIRENLARKLSTIYASDSIVKNIVRLEDSEQIKIIIEAIKNKFQIIIKEYTQTSANKGIYEQVAEPVAFASDYTRVWAYLPDRGGNILLRLSGLAGVAATYEPCKFEHLHKIGIIDIFRGYGLETKKIGLRLNIRAYGYMLEEFPTAKTQIQKAGHFHYELHTEVCDYAPVTRFFLGLPGDIEVIYPDELNAFIKNAYNKPEKRNLPKFAISYIDKAN